MSIDAADGGSTGPITDDNIDSGAPPEDSQTIDNDSQLDTGGDSSGVETPPVATQPQTPPEPQWYEQVGLPADTDPTAAIQQVQQQLAEARRLNEQLPQILQYARLGQQITPDLEQFNAWRTEQQRQQPADQKPFWAEAWAPPEFDPGMWNAISQRNPETGQLEPVPGVPPDLFHKGLEYQKYIQEEATKFWGNPHKYIHESPAMQEFKKQVMDEVRELASSEVGTHQVTETVQSYEQANASWLYQHRADGGIDVNPLSGEKQLSNAGRMFYDHIANDRQAGINNPTMLLERAHKYMQREAELAELRQKAGGSPNGSQANGAPATQPPPQTEAERLAQRQAGDLARLNGNSNQPATRRPNHSGTPGTNGAPPAAELSLRQRMALNMDKAGITEF